MVYKVTLYFIRLLYCDILSRNCQRYRLLEFIDMLASPSATTYQIWIVSIEFFKWYPRKHGHGDTTVFQKLGQDMAGIRLLINY